MLVGNFIEDLGPSLPPIGPVHMVPSCHFSTQCPPGTRRHLRESNLPSLSTHALQLSFSTMSLTTETNHFPQLYIPFYSLFFLPSYAITKIV